MNKHLLVGISLGCVILIGACTNSTPSPISSDPIDIPINIAKGHGGIDPTSFSYDGDAETLTGQVNGFNDGDVVSVFQDGSTSSTKAGNPVLIKGIKAATVELVETLPINADGTFTDTDYSGDLFDHERVYAISDGESISTPVIVTVSLDESNFDQIVVKAQATNDRGILEYPLAVDDQGKLIAFNLTDDEEGFCIGLLCINDGDNDCGEQGAEPTTLTCELENPLTQLQFGPDGELYGFDIETHDLVTISPGGAVLTLNTNSPDVTPMLRLSPNGLYAAQALENGDSLSLSVGTLEALSQVQAVPISITEDIVAEIDFAWLDDEHLIVIKNFSDLRYSVQFYNVSDYLGGNSQQISPQIELNTDVAIGNPLPFRVSTQDDLYQFTHDCESDADILFGCFLGLRSDTVMVDQIDLARSYHFTSVSADQLYSGVEFVGGEGQTIVGVLTDGDASRIAPGRFPSFSQKSNEYIAYLSSDSTGELQIAFSRIDALNYLTLFDANAFQSTLVPSALPEVIAEGDGTKATYREATLDVATAGESKNFAVTVSHAQDGEYCFCVDFCAEAECMTGADFAVAPINHASEPLLTVNYDVGQLEGGSSCGSAVLDANTSYLYYVARLTDDTIQGRDHDNPTGSFSLSWYHKGQLDCVVDESKN